MDEKTKVAHQKLKEFRSRTDLKIRPLKYMKKTFTGFDGKEHPLVLRYYQIQGVLHMLTMHRFVLGDDTGLGKCVGPDTLIKTHRGLVRIKDLCPEVTEPDTFVPIKDLKVRVGHDTYEALNFFYDGVKPSLKLRTKLGYEVEGSFEHPVFVRKENGDELWVPIGQVRKDLDQVKIDLTYYSFNDNFRIEKDPIWWDYRLKKITGTYPEEMTPELAFVLAVLCTRGHLTKSISVIFEPWDSQEIQDSFREVVEQMFDCKLRYNQGCYTLPRTRMVRFFRYLGWTNCLYQDGVFPWSILQSDRESVRVFLRHFLALSKQDSLDHLVFETNSDEVSRDVQTLLLSFGLLSFRTFPRIEEDLYQVYLRTDEDYDRFLEEVVEGNEPDYQYRTPEEWYYDTVEHVIHSESELYDLEVDHEHHCFVGNGILCHNTLQSITALCYLWEKNPDQKAIILTEKVAILQWASEFDKFSQNINVFTVTSQGPDKRQGIYDAFEESKGPTALVTNYQKAAIDFDRFRQWKDVLYVHDECTAYKSPKSRVHQACKALSDNNAARVWALSATIIKNNLLEGHGIYRVVVPGLFPTERKFIQSYSKYFLMPTGRGAQKIPKVTGYTASHIQKFRDKIDPYFLGRAKFEVASDLPPVTIKTVPLRLSQAQASLYKEALSGLLLVDTGEGLEEKELDQLSSLIYFQEIVNDPRLIGRKGKSTKLEWLRELLKVGDLADEKIIVFSRFKRMIDIIVPLLNQERDDDNYCVRITGDEGDKQRKEAMERFQDPSSPTRVVGVTMAAAQAINLQAAKATIYYDTPWSGGDFLQILGRMIRIGTLHKHVYAIHPVCQNTIDERVLDVLGQKMDLIEAVLGRRLKNASDDFEVEVRNEISDLWKMLRQDAVQAKKGKIKL